MHHLDLFTGIGGFHLAAMRCGFHTLCASEMDPYNCELIDRNLGLDNCGNIELAVIPRRMHPYSVIEEDIVPVEITGITDLTIDDFMEEILPFSDIITGGFPCQDVSPANTMGNRNGIDGEQSSLEFEQLRIIEELNPTLLYIRELSESGFPGT
jgi:site-specific DNA-cytosine methylase